MLTVKIFIVLNILIFSGDIFGQQLVVEISNCKIYDHQLKKSDKLAPQLFYKKFGFLPSSNTTEGLESLKHNLRLYKLKTIITNKILQNLEKKYFNKVVTQEDINDFLLKNQRNIAEDIKHDRLFLEAYKELKTSQLSDEKKYKLIYEKYHKMGLKNSFNFFKSSISNEDYIKFINERLKSYSLDNISQMQKTALFRQKLPKYVLHQLSTHDATTKEHIKLAEKHKCNFNDMLYMKWFIDEGNKMNFKVFDKQYGVSLEEILTTPTNF